MINKKINKKCHKLNLDDAKKYLLSDAAVKNLLPKLCLVSSKQLARILNKKNDRSLRSLRSQAEGFPFYKDSSGNVYYNLPEVMKELQVSLID
jgi:hypothetical protein|tara:strand:+ start:79 stop:357 length:279 start_codon:yes stop_codon:yes gene_type:complete